MAKELDVELGPEDARGWKTRVQINTGASLYSFIGSTDLKKAIKAARDKNDETPTTPMEPWVLRLAFERADEMVKRIKDDNVKIMSVELEPKCFETLGA